MAAHARYTAVLDACVLYSIAMTDALLSLATAGLCAAKWTTRMHKAQLPQCGSATCKTPISSPSMALTTPAGAIRFHDSVIAYTLGQPRRLPPPTVRPMR